MSASTATREQVYLPPRHLSDFVIHYRNADFHVHQFVLHHHSAYFRTYLDSLQPLVPVVRGRKRKSCSVDMSSLEERDDKCSHSPLVRCIDLPREFGIRSPFTGYATQDTFLLFLQHLYFSSTLHCPPFQPKPELRASLTETTPTCTSFPLACVTAAEVEAYSYRRITERMMVNESLVSLFHYFDCQAALRRCVDVILGPCWSRTYRTWELYWLPFATRYGMKKMEQRCLEGIVRNKRLFHVDDAHYKAELERLSREDLLRLLDAFARSCTAV